MATNSSQINAAIPKFYNDELFISTSKSSTLKMQRNTRTYSAQFQIPEAPMESPKTVNNVIGVVKIDASLVCHVCQKKTEFKQNPTLPLLKLQHDKINK